MKKGFRTKSEAPFIGKRGKAELDGWEVLVNGTENKDIAFVFFERRLDGSGPGAGQRRPSPGFVYTEALINLQFSPPEEKEMTKTEKVVEASVTEADPVAFKDPEINLDTMTFPQDHRKSNPGLHMLYTKWAIPHLVEIDKAIRRFDGFSNLNMMGVMDALFTERKKLVEENAAYAEADAILKTIQKHGGYPKR